MKYFLTFLILIQVYCAMGNQTDFPLDTVCHKFNIVEPAQEPSLQPRCRVDGDVFYLDGLIDSQMVYELKTIYPQIKRLELNSFGGNVEEAYVIANLIRSKGLITNVRKGARCGSACTLLFQAGVKRSAHSSVRFMYHPVRRSSDWFQTWTDGRKNFSREKWREYLLKFVFETKKETQILFGEYVKYGMDPKFLKIILAQPEDPNWFYEGNMDRAKNLVIFAKDLTAYNIVNVLYE